MKKILFVCSANKQRSKTAEDYFSENFTEYEFFSAGTNIKLCRKEGTNPLTDFDLDKFDLICAMETKHKHEINQLTENKHSNKIEVLNIPDHFKYYQKDLIELLKIKVVEKLT